MKTRWFRPVTGLGLLVLAGCVSAQSSSEYELPRTPFESRAGQITEHDLFIGIPRVIAQHGYVLEWQERKGTAYYFETQWKTRAPFDDERELGAEYARTRILFHARQHGRWYRLRIEVENVLGTASGEWTHPPRTKMFNRYARRLTDDVRSELTTGIRTY